MLERWGHRVIVTRNGEEAWDAVQGTEGPALLLIDWMMPVLDGPSLCRRIRNTPQLSHLWLIMLTVRDDTGDIVSGLSAGANDYVTKPFQPQELKARIEVGQRVVELQNSVAQRIAELEHASKQVRTLQGLIPICSYCKRVRDEREYWERVESYVSARSDARFSHGICPECLAIVEAKYGLEPEST